MNAEQAKKLREPFADDLIGKLPRVTCKACSQAQGKVCGNHSKVKCGDCGNYITTAHLHLDYVGHAAVSDRLLDVDRDWTWRFLAANADGSPVVVTAGFSDTTAKVGIWIVLTVCGVDTPGFGEGKGFKDAISDAIRNAAMRRGVALDLWSKEDLHGADVPEGERAAVEASPAPPAGAAPVGEQASPSPSGTSSPKPGASPGLPSTGDAPGAPSQFQAPTGRKASDARKKKLNVLVGKLRDDQKALTTEQLWTAVRGTYEAGARWRDLRDTLTDAEAKELIERLERYEKHVGAAAA